MASKQATFTCGECSTTYSTPRHLDSHQRNRCFSSKRSLTELLGHAKMLWEARKRRKITRDGSGSSANVGPAQEGSTIQSESQTQNRIMTMQLELQDDPALEEGWGTEALRTGPSSTRNHRSPASAFQHSATLLRSGFDEGALPEPLAPFIAPGTGSHAPNSGPLVAANQWWQSKTNRFSLWRRCYGRSPPTCDPDQSLTVEDLDDSQEAEIPAEPAPQSLGPFPNLSSFLFADWWWNGENDKSGKEMQKFLETGRQEGFSFQDVISTNWKATLDALDSDECDGDGSDDDWFDDADWISTPITIAVPFHRYMTNAAPQIDFSDRGEDSQLASSYFPLPAMRGVLVASN
ncbi:hypothetical protein BKA70DRAFT_1228477 [Coprinopsis sp. MPI-PUGE-AT-0042]|nr:hypothetical protein BKA70DRAFT_1228477 [Coprinopsis sp. MPI-PUGE-AT-0042]